MDRFRYRSKVVEIEAVQFSDRISEIDGPEPPWYTAARTIDAGEPGSISYCKVERTLKVATLEGVMTASPGDWIIRGTEGELYPCKPSVFERKYEPSA